MGLLLIFNLLLICNYALGDMYLHNPRGSNNRLDEETRGRRNGNRMCDTQNNDRGGYNVGSLYYYTGSSLNVEWTNQHSCGDANNHCEIIFQYMCDDKLRDGSSTNTIPDNPALCENGDCNSDLEYGMHEDYNYYVSCRLRERNMGLFTADQRLNGKTARFTRQNPGGTRRGYECPEERDYYPYWHPTPWTDIAVFTNQPSRCSYYKQESENVKPRHACIIPQSTFQRNARTNNPVIPNNREDCERVANATWTQYPPKNVPAPECIDTLWSRDNHLGNGLGGSPNHFNWTIPELPHEHCVFRARYNISTAEYNAWDGSVNSSLNSPSRNTPSELDVWSQFGLTKEQADEREYRFENNPQVQIFDTVDGVDVGQRLALQLAINTNQFGRTFQDRSHSFAIRRTPDAYSDCSAIHNLNVRGKRGNIVQVFPGVEYDFVPDRLVIGSGSCIHIQWTGSNTNPNNNDGQGRAGSDRSNMVLLRKQNYPEGNGMAVPPNLKHGHLGNSYPAHLGDNITFLGLSRQDRQSLAVLDKFQFGGEMSELDDAGTYFDMGLRKITQAGTYHYMCTRNNNFSNRSQKGIIIILNNAISSKRIGVGGGAIMIGDRKVVEVKPGAQDRAGVVTVESFTNEVAQQMNLVQTIDNVVTPVVRVRNEGTGKYTVRLKDNSNLAVGSRQMYVAATEGADFVMVDSYYDNGDIVTETDRDGIFLATSPGIGLLVGFLLAVVIITAVIVVVVIVYCVYRRRTVKKKYVGCVAFKNKFKRSLQAKV